MSVTIRKRKLKSGMISLALDIYVEGKRVNEALNLYLFDPPKTPIEKKRNKETLAFAESASAQKLLEINKGQFGFKSEKSSGEKDFLEFFKSLMNERQSSQTNYDNWNGTYKYLVDYSKGTLKFKDITIEFLEGFKNYLLTTKIRNRQTTLSQNSAVSYFNKLRASINRAFELDLISKNPVKKVSSLKPEDTQRNYLTFEEVQRISKVDCKYPILKRAFLFSCLSGMRWSDINNLKWNQLSHSEKSGWKIVFRQQKTKGQENLPLTEQAISYLGERGNPDERIFIGLKYSAQMNVELAKWIMKAGITKDITFHCARHTHATLLLSEGTDIYTVSKLLGHKDLKTTQLYAKVIDQSKIDAVNRIPQL